MMEFSLIIPIYKNEPNLDRLLVEVARIGNHFGPDFEAVFVVDGSPDRCYEILQHRLRESSFSSQLLLLSRNFGSFAAITAGLESARGKYFAVLAADLQEPPELIGKFFKTLASDAADVVFGFRESRSDPYFSKLASAAFWSLYRRFVIHDIPKGGVDVFGCNTTIRNRVLQFRENNSNLIALLFWIGYRREYIGYQRRPRTEGTSAWKLRTKIKYSFNSIFNFTDIPIQLLIYFGLSALLLSVLGSVILLISKFSGSITVPGYTATVLAILFFGAVTSLGLGIVGQYLWLTLQNTRGRPNYIVHHSHPYPPATVDEVSLPRVAAADPETHSTSA